MSLLRSIIADARSASPKVTANKNARDERQTDAPSNFQPDKLAKRANSQKGNVKEQQPTSDHGQILTYNNGEELSKNAHVNEERLSSGLANKLSNRHPLENPISQSYTLGATRSKMAKTPLAPTNNLLTASISQEHTNKLKTNSINPKEMFEKNSTSQEKQYTQNTKQEIDYPLNVSNSLQKKSIREIDSDSVITKTARQLEKNAIEKSASEKNVRLTKNHHVDVNKGKEESNPQQTLNTNNSASLLINKDTNQSNAPKNLNESKAFVIAEQSKMKGTISKDIPRSEKKNLTNINQSNEKKENNPTDNESLSWKNSASDEIVSTQELTSAETPPLRTTPAIVASHERTPIDALLQSQLQSLSSQALAHQTSQSQKKLTISPEQPKVHIGQVDIIIEAQPSPASVKPNNSISQIDIASSHLLRRL